MISALHPFERVQGLVATLSNPAQVVQPAASGTIAGDYTGQVLLQGVFNGVYNDAATPAPNDLGYIDLALSLTQSGNTVSGYVRLYHSLVFTTQYTITVTPIAPSPGPGTPTPAPQPLAIGPKVHGTFDGAKLYLESDQFILILNDEQTIVNPSNSDPATNKVRIPIRKITRQFSLTTTNIQGNGATLTGEYRETIWGYAPQPTTVVGTFTLQRPPSDGSTTGSSSQIFMPVIRR